MSCTEPVPESVAGFAPIWQPVGGPSVGVGVPAHTSVWLGNAPDNAKPSLQPGADNVTGVEMVMDDVCAVATPMPTMDKAAAPNNCGTILRIRGA